MILGQQGDHLIALTANHIFYGATRASLFTAEDVREFPIHNVVSQPMGQDIALFAFKSDSLAAIPQPFDLGALLGVEGEPVRSDQKLLAYGFPNTLDAANEFIPASHPFVSILSEPFMRDGYIMAKGSLGQGMSGGPAVNELGQVFGVVSGFDQKNPEIARIGPLPIDFRQKFKDFANLLV